MEQVNINVTTIDEQVTINATPNVTQILVNTNTGGGGVQSVVAGTNISVDNTDPANPIISATGGGGTQNLNEVLVEGNATDGENIFISDGDEITFDNGSRIRKGLTDAGNGGAKGVALVCSLDYELKWEAGRQYVMQQDGFTIREVSHNFTLTPSTTDDSTKGFVIDSRWILDNGDVYVCTDATEDSAVWELQVTDVQDLQNVTDIGSVTTNPISVAELELYDSVNDAYSNFKYKEGQYIFKDINDRSIKVFDEDGLEQTLNQDDFILSKEISSLTANRTRIEPNKDGTYAMLDDIPSVTGFVPYTGANQNVNLGEFELKAGQLTLDISPTGTAVVGTTRWNDTIGSSETTLKGGSVILKNGVDLVARVVNKVTPNTTLTKTSYQVVRISGAQGQRLAVNLAQANNDNNSADTLGVVCETIATNQEGFIMTVGQLENINTTGSLQGETWADGDVLYLSPTTAGRLTNIKPIAPAHIVIVGYVEYAHANNGKIYVKVMNGWELDELHNVAISTPLNNQGLIYETSTQLWKNKTILTDVNFGTFANSLTAKNTLVDADEVVSDDSADSNKAKKTSWLNVWNNFIKSKTDALYATIASVALKLDIASPSYTGLMTGTGTTQTGSSAIGVVDLQQTWNTTGLPSAIKLNVTDTASNANSLLLNLQTGGVTQFSVSKAGLVSATFRGNISTSLIQSTGSTTPIQFNMFGGATTPASINFTNGSAFSHTSTERSSIQVAQTFSPSSGTGIYNMLTLIETINQTGGANGITRGLFINPTLTAAADFRGIEVVNGSIVLPYRAETANYAIKTSDYLINITSGIVTATLPTAVGCAGKHYIVKNTGASVVTVATTSSQTIDGVTTATLGVVNKYIHVVSTGSNWIVIANN